MSLHKHAVTGEIRDLDAATLKRIAGTAKGEAWQPYTPPPVEPEDVSKRDIQPENLLEAIGNKLRWSKEEIEQVELSAKGL